jgi:hypothetical protein
MCVEEGHLRGRGILGKLNIEKDSTLVGWIDAYPIILL